MTNTDPQSSALTAAKLKASRPTTPPRRLATHPDPVVRGNAILGLGHLARTHRDLDREIIEPVISAALGDSDPYVRGQADAAADDVATFLGWQLQSPLPTVPRPLAVVAGVLMLVPGFLLAWAAIGIPAGLGWSAITTVISAVSMGGAVLCASASWRLLTGHHRKDGGLVSVPLLRASAVMFIAIPILALATGSWRAVHLPFWFVIAQGVGYFGVAATLFRLASRRSREKALHQCQNDPHGG